MHRLKKKPKTIPNLKDSYFTYLNNKEHLCIKQEYIEKTKLKEKKKLKNFKGYQFQKNDDVFKANRSILKNRYTITGNKKGKFKVGEKTLCENNLFFFQKISKQYWAVFSENQELIVMYPDLVEITNLLLNRMKTLKKEHLKINHNFFAFLEELRNSNEEMKERTNEIWNKLSSFQVEPIEDFLFS